MTDILLKTSNLTVVYPTKRGAFKALDDISIEIETGKIVGLVGESGAGKSTVGRAVLDLIDAPGYIAEGEIDFQGESLIGKSNDFFTQIRGRKVGYVFQNPMTALDPVMTIGKQVLEAIYANTDLKGEQAYERALDLLTQTRIKDPKDVMEKYPHQMSGGMCQRVVFAIAISANPDLIIADEPTTALDVSVQRSVMDTLIDLCRQYKISVMLVTHDIGVISEYCDFVYVMRHGKHVEQGPTQEVINHPKQDYTRNLMAAVPRLSKRLDRFRVLETVTDAQSKAREVILRYFQESDFPDNDELLLQVDKASCIFNTKSGFFGPPKTTIGLDTVSFTQNRKEILGIVGESGSGKSTMGRAILGLQRLNSGSITYKGTSLTDNNGRAITKDIRLSMQCIFQDPFSSLNPRMTAGENVTFPIRTHKLLPDWLSAKELAENLMLSVGLEASAAYRYPQEFSGGQRQRIAIARAMAFRPEFIFCDEPTSALDVSVQAETLNLMKDLRDQYHLTLLFVSHDLAVVRQMCDRIIVMRNGAICEIANPDQIIENPSHDYTRSLIAAMPKLDLSA
ncbi:MAG: ABC transporter ATP-binding protein [Cohaesibacter sp.]|nr:ABC transporter ATP-binding protein [Cohaesibacter sp.]